MTATSGKTGSAEGEPGMLMIVPAESTPMRSKRGCEPPAPRVTLCPEATLTTVPSTTAIPAVAMDAVVPVTETVQPETTPQREFPSVLKSTWSGSAIFVLADPSAFGMRKPPWDVVISYSLSSGWSA